MASAVRRGDWPYSPPDPKNYTEMTSAPSVVHGSGLLHSPAPGWPVHLADRSDGRVECGGCVAGLPAEAGASTTYAQVSCRRCLELCAPSSRWARIRLEEMKALHAVDRSRFPHQCACGAPGYEGFNMFECSASCAAPGRRRSP